MTANKSRIMSDEKLRALAQELNSNNLSREATLRRLLSPTDVLIEITTEPGYKILSLPKKFSNNKALQTLVGYFASPDYVKQNRQVQKKHIATFERFLSHLNKQYETSVTIDKSVLNGFMRACSSEITELMSVSHFMELRRAFFRAVPFFYGPAHNWPDEIKTAYTSFKGIKVRRNQEKTPPLGKYLEIPSTQFTNKELFFGLRMGAIWTLNRIQEMRLSVCKNPKISDCLLELKGEDLHAYKAAFKGFVDFKKDPDPKRFNHKLIARIGGVIWNDIANDPLMAEWQFYTFKKIRPQIENGRFTAEINFNSSDHQLLLQSFILPDGTTSKRPKFSEKNKLAKQKFRPHLSAPFSSLPITRPVIWAEELLIHTSLEKLLMVWLLGSERGQTSGISKLLIPDVTYGSNNSTLQISTIKLRLSGGGLHSKPRDTTVLSNIYRRNSPPYKAYDRWIKQLSQGMEFICDYNPNKEFLPTLGKRIQGIIASPDYNYITASFLPLLLLATDDSAWQKSFLTDTRDAEREAAAFIEILRNRLRKLWRDTGNSAIPTSVIGQSLVVETQLENNESNSSSTVESATIGHSPATGRNVYKDRFYEIGVAEIFEPVAAFSRRVGNDKIELAKSMALRLYETNEKISLSDLEDMAGIASSSRKIESYLSNLDEEGKLAITGEIVCDGKTLIVQTDITAAQIFGYITHLETHLPELMKSPRYDNSIKHLSKLIYLRSVFQEFPAHLQEQGKHLSEEMNFPFPPLD